MGTYLVIAAIPFGTLAGWATFASVCIVGYYFTRGGGGQALNILRDANAVLTTELERRDEAIRDRDERIKQLEATHSLEPILTTLTDLFMQHDAEERKVWTGHEERAQERHEVTIKAGDAQLRVLGMIAERLGPEPNGHSLEGDK